MVRAVVTPTGREPIEADLFVDTGAGDALYFGRPFVEEHGLLDTLERDVRLAIPGVGGDSKHSVGRVVKLEIGGQTFDRPVTYFSHDEHGAFGNPLIAGIIGAEVLRQFTVFFDYTRERLILERNNHFGEPFEFDMGGLLVVAGGDQFETRRVRAVIEGSPGAVAGVQADDVIETVNGRPAGDFSLAAIIALTREEGRDLALRLRRGGEVVDVTVPLRRYV